MLEDKKKYYLSIFFKSTKPYSIYIAITVSDLPGESGADNIIIKKMAATGLT